MTAWSLSTQDIGIRVSKGAEVISKKVSKVKVTLSKLMVTKVLSQGTLMWKTKAVELFVQK